MSTFQKEDETRRNRIWKALTGYEKHMTLMYFYRILADREHICDYVETYRFQTSGICPADLPDFVFFLKPDQLREMAREQQLSPIPAKEEKVKPSYEIKSSSSKSYKGQSYDTRDNSDYLPEGSQ